MNTDHLHHLFDLPVLEACWFLTIIFILLKLTNLITWSWLWVLAPVWIPTIFLALILAIILIRSPQ